MAKSTIQLRVHFFLTISTDFFLTQILVREKCSHSKDSGIGDWNRLKDRGAKVKKKFYFIFHLSLFSGALS